MTDVNNAAEAEPEFDPDAPAPGNQGLAYEDGDGFSFNMNETKATSGYPLIPIGTYDATIEDCQYKISQSSGNPMWQVKWAMNVNQDGKDKVMKVTSFVVFSEAQRGRAKAFLTRVAPDLAALEDFNPKLLASQMVGKPAKVKINHQPDQNNKDEMRANVADVFAPSAGGAGGSFSQL